MGLYLTRKLLEKSVPWPPGDSHSPLSFPFTMCHYMIIYLYVFTVCLPAGLSAFCPPLNSQGGTLRSSAKVYPTGAQAPPTSREPHPPTTKAPPTPRLAPPLPRLPGSKRACWRSQHRAIPGQLCPAPLGGFSCCPCSGRGPSATCPPRKAQARRQLEVRDSWESVTPQNL